MYLWIKALHILLMTSWFAGLFYLPRLYVNMAQPHEPQTTQVLIEMSQRLYRFMMPLAVLTIITGFGLYLYYGIGMGSGWIHAKITLVAVLAVYHWYCGRILARFKAGTNTRSHVYYRWFNEVPVVVLLVVLILVVLKPF